MGLDVTGISVVDDSKPRLFIPWDNMESVDVYTGFSGGNARVAISVKDVGRCFDGLTVRQKARALKNYVYGADLICFSTASFKVTPEQFSADAQRLTTVPVTSRYKVDSITVKPEPNQQPVVEDPNELPAVRAWRRSPLEKVVVVAFGALFCGLFWLMCISEKQPDLILNIGVGLLVALGLCVLGWYWLDSPLVTLDAQKLVVKESLNGIVRIPLTFIEGTRMIVSLDGLNRALLVVLNDTEGYLATLSDNERKVLRRKVRQDGAITFWLHYLAAPAHEIQSELNRRLGEAKRVTQDSRKA